MYLNLADYQEEIDLFQEFQAEKAELSQGEQEGIVNHLLDSLELSLDKLGVSPSGLLLPQKRTLLRAALNITEAGF
ncbi:MAG: hypothetical protein AAF696_12580, partial [Bacteroidota bacterium]